MNRTILRLLVLVCLASAFASCAAPSAARAYPIRVVSYNVKHGRGYGVKPLRENLAAFLRADTLNPAASAPGEDDGAFLHPEAAPGPGPACVVGVIDDAIPLALERLAVRGSDGALRSRIASAWA